MFMDREYFAPGEFVVRDVHPEKGDLFRCERMTGDGKGEMVDFFIGYVEQLVRIYEEE